MPKVSVIIPNYNHARYLRKRIQSVLDQTFQDFDLTYLDDASSDDSNAVFAEFDNQPRIQAIYNSDNSGSPFKQWNKGIHATSGEYIWIAESDDVADPHLLATLVPLLDQNPNVGLAYCQSCQIDCDDTIIQTMHWWTNDLSPDRWSHDFVASGIEECQKYLLYKNTIPNASAVLIRRSVYEAIGSAEESMFLTGDWMTWVRMLLESDIAFSAQVLNSFRAHASSVRSRTYLSGTEYYERMMILQTLQNATPILPSTFNQIKAQLIASWVNLTFDRDNKIDFQNHINFYRLAKRINAPIESVVIKQLAHRAKNSFTSKIRYLSPKIIFKL
jgi:glycosyltransferase involved in cell wall biosynthesis